MTKHTIDTHPLSSELRGHHKVYVELEPAPFRKSRLLRPKWRKRDGEWAVQAWGCVQFLAANPGGVDRFRIWTATEYRERGFA